MIYPYDVTVTPDNDRIVVSDSGNHRLLIFNTLGVLIAKFGYKGYLCGNFDSPRGVTVNEEGHIILTDFNVHHILVIHPNGRTAQIIGEFVSQFLYVPSYSVYSGIISIRHNLCTQMNASL